MKTNFSNELDPDDIPMRPLCHNAIAEWEPCSVIEAHGSLALAHQMCIDDCEES